MRDKYNPHLPGRPDRKAARLSTPTMDATEITGVRQHSAESSDQRPAPTRNWQARR